MKTYKEMGKGYLNPHNKKVVRAFNVVGKNLPKEFTEKYKDKLVIKNNRVKLSGDGVFYTLQGEGPYTGEPAIFVRVHVCNLHCTFCDAYYTWSRDVEEFWKESKDYTFKQLASMIKKAWKCKNPRKKKRVVFTGGEPTLQRNQLTEVMKLLPEDEWEIEMETNGTIMPTDYMLKRVHFNCSPKLALSGNEKELRYKPAVLQALNKADTWFKFVVIQPSDLDEIDRLYVKRVGIDVNKLSVMPQGVTTKEIEMNMRAVAEACKVKGFRLFTRLHVQIWGGALRKV